MQFTFTWQIVKNIIVLFFIRKTLLSVDQKWVFFQINVLLVSQQIKGAIIALVFC